MLSARVVVHFLAFAYEHDSRRLIYWLMHWLVHWPVYWLVESLVDRLVDFVLCR
jgi:hypothetical protein